MTLAEKIMSLRKRSGSSQEELADQLGVTRQSVSKWEAASSIPDISKIIQMSELFGVSTDYLLRDDMNDEAVINTSIEDTCTGKFVSMEEATLFMDLMKAVSNKMAAAVALCIWSPILLIMLAGFSEKQLFNITETAAAGVGLAVLLIMVAAAVFVFVMIGGKTKSYEYLKTERISLQYGVEAMVRRRQESYNETRHLMTGIGVVLIIVGTIPVVVSGLCDNDLYSALSVCLLLFLVGIAVNLFVKGGTINESFQKLLQEEDYAPVNKAVNKKIGWFPGVYCCVITAIYLAYSFITSNWGMSWVIWPVAGVSFAAIYAVFQVVMKKK